MQTTSLGNVTEFSFLNMGMLRVSIICTKLGGEGGGVGSGVFWLHPFIYYPAPPPDSHRSLIVQLYTITHPHPHPTH